MHNLLRQAVCVYGSLNRGVRLAQGFNILGPALNQVDNMSTKRSVAAGVGLSAAMMLAAGQADAAQEVAQLAGDNRPLILAGLFLPVLGWVVSTNLPGH